MKGKVSMKIIQVLPCLAYGDAIGNDTLALDKAIKEMGYETEIFTEDCDKRLPKFTAKTMNQWRHLSEEDIIIYHLAIGWSFVDYIEKEKCKKIAIYHNVTPAHFYKNYNKIAYHACDMGIGEVKKLKNTFDYCLADSEFNKQDLIRYGYTCKIDVLPILIAFDDYRQEATKAIIEKYKGSGSNIIFVGRVVPNKKHEDVIAAFYFYKKYHDPLAKLFLVGSCPEGDAYGCRLKAYIRKLNLSDVYFTGHIAFKDILAYYKIADLFLCMSEHEGFCVPLVEAMTFDVPVLAYNSCAIEGTLGGSGLMFQDKNPLEVAGLMARILRDDTLKNEIIKGQKERLKDYDNKIVKNIFKNYLQTFIEES